MTSRRSALLLGFALPTWAKDKDFWNSKKPAEWSLKQVEQVLARSPWAKEGTPSLGAGAMGGRGGEGGGGGGGRGRGGGGGGGMGGPPGGMGGQGRGGPGGDGSGGMEGGGAPSAMPQFRALVRWESALPVNHATKRQPPADAAEFYILSVSGMPLMGGSRGGPPNPQRRQEMLATLKEATQLQRKGRDPIHAAKLGQAQGGLVFFFSRDFQPITLEDKDVVFLTKTPAMELKVKFALKDMVYNGQLSL